MSSCNGNCASCSSTSCGDRKAESLLAALNPKSTVKKVIAVVSGKGGVGKSTVSAGLAVSFSTLGYKTLVVDMDEGLRCLDLMLGLDKATVFDLSDILMGKEPEEATYQSEIISNLLPHRA